MLVLDVVGGGQVHQVRPLGFEQRHAGGEHELRQVRAVDRRQRHADAGQHVVDAVFFKARLVGLLRGEADALQAVAEQRAQLVLGRHHGDLRAGLGRGGQHRGRAQVAGVVHQHLFAGFGVVEEVAADTVHRRRHAGHDRQVVGVGERRHHAVAGQHRAALRQAGKEGRDAGLHGQVDVFLLAAVDADDHGGAGGKLVAVAVGFDVGVHGGSRGMESVSRCRMQGGAFS
ncbi:hypothetical protein D3C72_1289910 [compost metagenome]